MIFMHPYWIYVSSCYSSTLATLLCFVLWMRTWVLFLQYAARFFELFSPESSPSHIPSGSKFRRCWWFRWCWWRSSRKTLYECRTLSFVQLSVWILPSLWFGFLLLQPHCSVQLFNWHLLDWFPEKAPPAMSPPVRTHLYQWPCISRAVQEWSQKAAALESTPLTFFCPHFVHILADFPRSHGLEC